MISYDLHTHTNLSTDGVDEMSAMLEGAAKAGLKGICFTEHYDYDNTFDEGEDAFIVDIDAYLEKYNSLKSTAEKLGIEALFGIEMGLQTYLAEDYHNLLSRYPFDFVIGSSHMARRMDPALPGYFNSFDNAHDAVMAYFDAEVANAMCHSDFDVYGHLDYVWRYIPGERPVFDYNEYADSLDRLLNTLIKKGKGIELNTAGFRKGMDGPNPDISIIKRYLELGGELITIGSDAHNTADIAADFDKAENILKDLGVTKYAIFRQRKAEYVEL